MFSRNVDKEVAVFIQKIIDNYVLNWLRPLLEDPEAVGDIEAKFKRDLWKALKKLNERLLQVDKVQLLASDVIQKLTEHFSRHDH